jgi:hypothetical protein
VAVAVEVEIFLREQMMSVRTVLLEVEVAQQIQLQEVLELQDKEIMEQLALAHHSQAAVAEEQVLLERPLEEVTDFNLL